MEAYPASVAATHQQALEFALQHEPLRQADGTADRGATESGGGHIIHAVIQLGCSPSPRERSLLQAE
jgi:hypothetical protein